VPSQVAWLIVSYQPACKLRTATKSEPNNNVPSALSLIAIRLANEASMFSNGYGAAFTLARAGLTFDYYVSPTTPHGASRPP